MYFPRYKDIRDVNPDILPCCIEDFQRWIETSLCLSLCELRGSGNVGRCEAEVDTFSSVKIHLPPSLAPFPLAHLQLHPTDPKTHSYVIDLSYRGNLKIIFIQSGSFDLI